MNDQDAAIRSTAFQHLRELCEVHDHLTQAELKPGFIFNGERIPLINPRRGIFKPRQIRFLLSIKTVFPKPRGKVWYDDQRQVHRQIFDGEETVDYAFMGQDPNAADNRCLREAFENGVPIIYFLGIAPGRYQPIFPIFISGWDAKTLSAEVCKARSEPGTNRPRISSATPPHLNPRLFASGEVMKTIICLILMIMLFSCAGAQTASTSSQAALAPETVIREFYRWYIHDATSNHTHVLWMAAKGRAAMSKYVTQRFISEIVRNENLPER